MTLKKFIWILAVYFIAVAAPTAIAAGQKTKLPHIVVPKMKISAGMRVNYTVRYYTLEKKKNKETTLIFKYELRIIKKASSEDLIRPRRGYALKSTPNRQEYLAEIRLVGFDAPGGPQSKVDGFAEILRASMPPLKLVVSNVLGIDTFNSKPYLAQSRAKQKEAIGKLSKRDRDYATFFSMVGGSQRLALDPISILNFTQQGHRFDPNTKEAGGLGVKKTAFGWIRGRRKHKLLAINDDEASISYDTRLNVDRVNKQLTSLYKQKQQRDLTRKPSAAKPIFNLAMKYTGKKRVDMRTGWVKSIEETTEIKDLNHPKPEKWGSLETISITIEDLKF